MVLYCVEVERAATGISWFMTLVRKLTNRSCFLFCSYNVNRPPSCLSCSHPRPTNSTDSVLDSLPVSPIFFFSYLFPAVFIYLGLFPHSDPSCLVRGWIYFSCLTGESYTLSLLHMEKGIFSQRETGTQLQCSSCSKHPSQNI